MKLYGAAKTWNHVHNMKNICRLCLLLSVMRSLGYHAHVPNDSQFFISSSQHISAQPVCSCLMRCCSIRKAVGFSGSFTASFKNLTVSDLTPCNRSHTSNPFSRKHCVEIGTEPCVEMWRCTSLLKNRGTVVLMLQLWLQTILKHGRDGNRGEPKYL